MMDLWKTRALCLFQYGGHEFTHISNNDLSPNWVWFLVHVNISFFLFGCLSDDIILVSEFHAILHHHLNALDGFWGEKELMVNLEKTNVMSYHISALFHRQAVFTLLVGKVLVDSYFYLEVKINKCDRANPMTQVTKNWLTQEVMQLGHARTTMPQAHFQSLIPNTMVTHTLLYDAAVWLQACPSTCRHS